MYMMNTSRPRVSQKEHAYRQLRGRLLDRMLLPGDRLREIPLAEKLGVSRIPLREAMDQLASEGLVERVPGLGSYVRSASPKELRELYEMREVLECFAAEDRKSTRLNSSHLGSSYAVFCLKQ